MTMRQTTETELLRRRMCLDGCIRQFSEISGNSSRTSFHVPDNIGTGANPVFKLPKRGQEIAGALRGHLGNGGNMMGFRIPVPEAA